MKRRFGCGHFERQVSFAQRRLFAIGQDALTWDTDLPRSNGRVCRGGSGFLQRSSHFSLRSSEVHTHADISPLLRHYRTTTSSCTSWRFLLLDHCVCIDEPHAHGGVSRSSVRLASRRVPSHASCFDTDARLTDGDDVFGRRRGAYGGRLSHFEQRDNDVAVEVAQPHSILSTS